MIVAIETLVVGMEINNNIIGMRIYMEWAPSNLIVNNVLC